MADIAASVLTRLKNKAQVILSRLVDNIKMMQCKRNGKHFAER